MDHAVENLQYGLHSILCAGQRRPHPRSHPHRSVYNFTPQAWKKYIQRHTTRSTVSSRAKHRSVDFMSIVESHCGPYNANRSEPNMPHSVPACAGGSVQLDVRRVLVTTRRAWNVLSGMNTSERPPWPPRTSSDVWETSSLEGSEEGRARVGSVRGFEQVWPLNDPQLTP